MELELELEPEPPSWLAGARAGAAILTSWSRSRAKTERLPLSPVSCFFFLVSHLLSPVSGLLSPFYVSNDDILHQVTKSLFRWFQGLRYLTKIAGIKSSRSKSKSRDWKNLKNAQVTEFRKIFIKITILMFFITNSWMKLFLNCLLLKKFTTHPNS